MITIELQQMVFYEHHGIYEEERRVMNSFEVNLSVSYMENNPVFERIADTISYVNLFKIVQEKMKEPVYLLEKICQGIILNIKHQYPTVSEIRISIYKLQAPIEHFVGKVGVTMHRSF
ncbi:MAG TPA: dihydroneopterin aldolase [Chitinophagaceae bacterium]|jgi:7,8-dihydroneopterin aldolase/epimerase/oxygenase|nr:dihydroneopterin aldolase [Chitinophagaceae bacterium]